MRVRAARGAIVVGADRDEDVLGSTQRLLEAMIARNEVVTDDLVNALLNGTIGGAALDVTDPEPLPDGHPLWSMPGVLITPHIGGDVAREEHRAWQLVAEQVERLARGEPLRNVVVDGY